MLLRGLLFAAALVAGVAASAGVILIDPDTLVNRDAEGETLSLAPISLGNPTTAAKLTTRRRETPRNGAPGALQGAFTGAVTALPDLKVPLRVGRGDTLAGMLTGAGVSAADAQGAISALSKHFNPRRIRRGQTVSVLFTPPAMGSPEADRPEPGKFLGFVVEPDYDTVIRVEKTAEGAFSAAKIKKTLTQAPARAGGVIRTSLYVAGRKAGIPRRVLAELIRAYSWDVDFQRDIRAGDRFEVLYMRFFDGPGGNKGNDKGRLVYSGPILYAALTLSGKRYPIYLHATKDGNSDYFDDKGQSARKALMRTPIDGARLSSGFGRRRHPILGYTKLHRGVDFAAPRGTPIYAAGNGVVVQSGRNGAYGKYVRIRHNSRYSTAYAHMRVINRSARRGKRVKQGQIIGTVGSTGRSTGPHLHYEILAGGVRTNPMKVKMPSGRKLKGEALEDFQVARAVIDGKFAALEPETKVAAAGK
ncbi:MAG: peptidoglycan DD-metalloendopeptidase family protein [Proteobacteria bacterium]|nr:peptidoglycan DD-metalloendopeptidase family protein [Pseudomonadota bacterium]